jgi:hypothetical protein
MGIIRPSTVIILLVDQLAVVNDKEASDLWLML